MLSKLSIFTHSFTELQSVFSDQTTNLPAHSWRSQIAPDHLYLDETELIQALLPNKYDKSCRSFRDGVGPCNQRFGNRNVCHGLSFDLSFVLSNMPQPGPYVGNPSMSQSSASQSGTWPSPRFPPAPPSSPPPTLAYPFPSRPSTPPCSPTMPCPPTQVASPSTPSIPSSQPRQAGTPYVNSPGGQTTADDSRTYGFDPNPHWQEDKDHYDNQKINGLTFPRCIRQSAFTQKLDIEGCDPLKLPVAAPLYQQANNFWLRKLAHGREVYLIPTGDIAAVVFTTELLTQLRNKGVDMDKVASCKARQDGKLLDKTNNTKYAAQQVADLIHSWVPTRTADPDTQHELTQLRSQLAQLRQQLGEIPGDPSSPNTTGPSASSPPPIHAALLRSSQSPAPPAPPGFDPSSVPLSIRGLLKTSHHLLPFEPSTNG